MIYLKEKEKEKEIKVWNGWWYIKNKCEMGDDIFKRNKIIWMMMIYLKKL